MNTQDMTDEEWSAWWAREEAKRALSLADVIAATTPCLRGVHRPSSVANICAACGVAL